MAFQMKRCILFAAAAGGAVTVGRLSRRYRHDLNQAWDRLNALDRHVVSTAFGDVEYAEQGTGEPLVVVHGILGGCDSGLLSASDLPRDRRLIAPSRFGYLGSALPSGATPADQADAFASLLDQLGVKSTDVVGISAGTSSTLQFALRHPDRVKHLIVVSGNHPGNPTAAAPPSWARFLYRDVPMWAMKVFGRKTLTGLVGVPKGFTPSAEAAEFVDELIESIFPVAPRAAGATFDAYVSNPDVNDYPLEQITVPVLLVHALDDPLCSYDAAQQAASRIPQARLVTVPAGGHLMLDQSVIVAPATAAFLAEPTTSASSAPKKRAGMADTHTAAHSAA